MNEADYEKKFIEVNGVKTCYIEAGEGEPLILIHGGGAGANSYGNWFACLPLFAKKFRTIAIDMVGFGQSKSYATNHVFIFELLFKHALTVTKSAGFSIKIFKFLGLSIHGHE